MKYFNFNKKGELSLKFLIHVFLDWKRNLRIFLLCDAGEENISFHTCIHVSIYPNSSNQLGYEQMKYLIQICFHMLTVDEHGFMFSIPKARFITINFYAFKIQDPLGRYSHYTDSVVFLYYWSFLQRAINFLRLPGNSKLP